MANETGARVKLNINEISEWVCGFTLKERGTQSLEAYLHLTCSCLAFYVNCRGTAAASPPPTKIGDPALYGSQPLVTPISLCRFRD